MVVRISELCRDPKLREVFRRTEGRGGDPLLPVEPERPWPLLEDATAAEPVEAEAEET